MGIKINAAVGEENVVDVGIDVPKKEILNGKKELFKFGGFLKLSRVVKK